jgi:hypothetical protein
VETSAPAAMKTAAAAVAAATLGKRSLRARKHYETSDQ